jgi:hypothetical protein
LSEWRLLWSLTEGVPKKEIFNSWCPLRGFLEIVCPAILRAFAASREFHPFWKRASREAAKRRRGEEAKRRRKQEHRQLRNNLPFFEPSLFRAV